MAEQVYGLSADDRATLQEMVRWFRTTRENKPVHNQPETPLRHGGCYVALVNGIIYGTGSAPELTGTGTGSPYDRGGVNNLLCRIYQINEYHSDEALVDTGIEELVYNVGQSAVYGPQFVPIVLDEFGYWCLQLDGKSTEILKVVGPKSGGWQPAYTQSYNVASGTWTSENFVYVAEPGGGTFDVNEYLLDAHLVGKLSNRRRYLCKKSGSGSSTQLWAKIIDQPGTGTGTIPGDWYAAYLGTWTSSTVFTEDTGTVIAVRSPNWYPLKIGSIGRVNYIETSGGYDRYLGEAEHWDFGNC